MKLNEFRNLAIIDVNSTRNHSNTQQEKKMYYAKINGVQLGAETQDELVALIAKVLLLQPQTAPVTTGSIVVQAKPRTPRKPEETWAHRSITKVGDGAARLECALVNDLVPVVLKGVGSTTTTLGERLTMFGKASTQKSQDMRPWVTEQTTLSAEALRKQTEAFIAANNLQ